MIKHLTKSYSSEYEKDLNIPLMYKEFDRPLVEYVLDSWKSLQILEGVKFLGYEYTENESEIEINKYIYKREKGKRRNEKYDYKFIDDSRYGLLTVKMLISVKEKEFSTGETILREKVIKKSMLIPLQDEHGLFYINGKRYNLIFQMVEKSTYTSANGVILKSLMPFAIKRQTATFTDMKEKQRVIPYYTIDIYRKEQPVMLIFASKGGLNYALQYAIPHYPYFVIEFVTKYDVEDEKHLYFQISSKLFLKVREDLFEKFQYIQSIVGGILFISTNRLTLEKIDNTDIWIKKLSNNNIEKGRNVLNSIKRLMDETTKNILRVDIYDKMDVTSVIRWMTMNFGDLRMKDNMNLENKRLRCNEYIASLLTLEFSRKLMRIMSLGPKATLDNYREMFRFPGNILIQKMHASGVFRFD